MSIYPICQNDQPSGALYQAPYNQNDRPKVKTVARIFGVAHQQVAQERVFT